MYHRTENCVKITNHPTFIIKTIIYFRVIGNLKIDFSGLVFFSEKKSDFIFRIFGQTFFLNCVFLQGIQ